MKFLDVMKKAVADGVAAAKEHAPGIASGVAGKAIALGQAAASVTASVAAGAYENVRDFAADRLKGSKFTDIDVEQAAGAMEMLQLGVRNPDGTFRLLTAEERLAMSRIVLAATLEDDGPAVDDDEGDD